MNDEENIELENDTEINNVKRQDAIKKFDSGLYEEAIEILLSLAEKGDIESQLNLGMCHLLLARVNIHGISALNEKDLERFDIGENLSLGAKWLKNASDQNLEILDRVSLGVCLMSKYLFARTCLTNAVHVDIGLSPYLVYNPKDVMPYLEEVASSSGILNDHYLQDAKILLKQASEIGTENGKK